MNTESLVLFFVRFAFLFLLADPGFVGIPRPGLVRVVAALILCLTWKK